MTEMVAFLFLWILQFEQRKPYIRLVYITFPDFVEGVSESVVSNFLCLVVNVILDEVIVCFFDVHNKVLFIACVLGIFTINYYQNNGLIQAWIIWRPNHKKNILTKHTYSLFSLKFFVFAVGISGFVVPNIFGPVVSVI